jgi:hypothetical protein
MTLARISFMNATTSGVLFMNAVHI